MRRPIYDVAKLVDTEIFSSSQKCLGDSFGDWLIFSVYRDCKLIHFVYFHIVAQ